MSDDWTASALAVFRAACELEQDQRSAFLDGACKGDDEFRRHVEAMLAWDDTGGAEDDLTGSPPVRLALSHLARQAESVPEPASLPESIGGYRIVRLVAHGGMGIVYEARQEHPRRRVAIKVARVGGTTGERAQRFELEAQLLARLDHPGIAQIIEAGTTGPEAGAQPFFVMEYIEGRSLTDFAAANLHTTRNRLELMVAVCEAVGFAHRQGVIHRDLKPDNVLVDQNGRPKVLDFGVAKVEAAGGFDAATLRTEAGRILGTLGYMAPEQLGGLTEGLGPQADVYSLGVMLYELLTGRLPHELRGATLTRALAIVTTTDAPLLSVVRPEHRGDIEALVAKALEKDARHRYADAAALQQDLERHLRGEPVLARPAGPLRRATKWARRNPALATAACGLFLALATVAVVMVVKNQEVRANLDEIRLHLDARDAQLAVAKADELWPTRPERVRALDQWLQSNRALVGRLPGYHAALEHLRARAGTLAAGASATADAPLHDELVELEQLVRDLEALAANEDLFARMEGRRDLAGSIVRLTVEDRRADWDAAIARIRKNGKYHGLTIGLQVGLVPLGPDPDSGLEEFLHFETHAGEIPRRDAAEHLPPVTGDTGLVFVLIPVVPGEQVWIGAQSEDPNADYYDEHALRIERLHQEPPLAPFFLSKYEMTQGQWLRAVGENPSMDPHSLDKPVNMVSWHECEKTMQRLGLVLPDDVQWEYGARAEKKTVFWTDDDADSLAPKRPDDPDSVDVAENLFDKVAADKFKGWARRWNVQPAPWRDPQKQRRFDEGGTDLAAVGSYRANPYGLFDVGGNVMEWCSNLPRGNPPPPGNGRRMLSRIVRGGSLKRGVVDARSAAGRDLMPEVYLDELGLRPAMVVQPAAAAR